MPRVDQRGPGEAAIRARLLFKSSNPDICQIVVDAAAVVAGTRVYDLHESVVHITRAVFIPDGTTTEYELYLTDRVEQDRRHPGWRNRVDIPAQAIHDDTELELGCKPSVAGTIRIKVLPHPAGQDRGQRIQRTRDPPHPPPLPDPLGASPGYSRPDSDLYDPKRAALEEARFTEHFGIGLTPTTGATSRPTASITTRPGDEGHDHHPFPRDQQQDRPYPPGAGWLTYADNVHITDIGGIERRDGYTLDTAGEIWAPTPRSTSSACSTWTMRP